MTALGENVFWNWNNVFFTFRLRKQIFSWQVIYYKAVHYICNTYNFSSAIIYQHIWSPYCILGLSILCPQSEYGISLLKFYKHVLSQTEDIVRKQDHKWSFVFFERQKTQDSHNIWKEKNNENSKTQIRWSIFLLVFCNSWVWPQAKVELFLSVFLLYFGFGHYCKCYNFLRANTILPFTLLFLVCQSVFCLLFF